MCEVFSEFRLGNFFVLFSTDALAVLTVERRESDNFKKVELGSPFDPF